MAFQIVECVVNGDFHEVGHLCRICTEYALNACGSSWTEISRCAANVCGQVVSGLLRM